MMEYIQERNTHSAMSLDYTHIAKPTGHHERRTLCGLRYDLRTRHWQRRNDEGQFPCPKCRGSSQG